MTKPQPTQPTSELVYVVVSPSGMIICSTFALFRRRWAIERFMEHLKQCRSPLAGKPWKSLYRRGWRVRVAKMEVQA